MKRAASVLIAALSLLGTLPRRSACSTSTISRASATSAIRRSSPAGDWVVYTVRTVDSAADKRETHLWMTSFDGARTVQLTSRKGESESTPRWRPDGRWLAFLSGRTDDNKNDQVWLLDRLGGEAQKLTDFKGGVDDLAWSPDGKRLALIVSDEDKDDTGGDDKKTAKPIVIDRFAFMQDIDGYQTALRDASLRLRHRQPQGRPPDARRSTTRRCRPGRPTVSRIAFVSKRHKDFDRDENWDLFVVDAHKGATPRPLTTYLGADNAADAQLSGSPPARKP